VYPGAFSNQRRGWKTWRCTASVCKKVPKCTVGLSPCGDLSLLSYPGFFFSVSCTVSPFIRNVFFYRVTVVLLSVCSLCWFNCQYLPSDWLKRLPWGHLIESRRSQRPSLRLRELLSLQFSLLFYCVCHLHRLFSLHDIYRTPMARYSLICAESSQVPLNTIRPNSNKVPKGTAICGRLGMMPIPDGPKSLTTCAFV